MNYLRKLSIETYIILCMCLMFCAMGCAAVDRAVMDYNYTISSADQLYKVKAVSDGVEGFFNGFGSVYPIASTLAPVLGSLAAFLTGIVIGRKKRSV